MNKREWSGETASKTVHISAELLDNFTALSGDISRIHVDDQAAQARGFKGRVVHGFLLGALISSVIGTQLPGHEGVLQKSSLSFHKPCYVGDEILIEVSVAEYIESVRVLMLNVTVKNAGGEILVKGEIQSGLTA
jgi:3-hydroxybutyryl-CoA dehydratase